MKVYMFVQNIILLVVAVQASMFQQVILELL